MPFPPRRRLPTSSRLALWLLALALAMKAALPMLAAVSAGLQDRAVAEVCTVYGVKTVAVALSAGADAQGDDQDAATASHHDHRPSPGHDGGSPHRGAEHCALGALPASAGAPEARLAPPAAVADAGRPAASPSAAAPRPDAAARWAGLIEHGPPAGA